MKLNKKFKIIFILPILLLSFCGQGMKALLQKVDSIDIDINDDINVSMPIYNYSSGSYSHDLEIVIISDTEGAQIFYTLDNSKPDIDSNLYTDPITLDGDGNDLIIRSVAYLDETYSEETTAKYEINYTKPSTPQILIDGIPFVHGSDGYYTTDIEISMVSSTPGAIIYYTTDGSTPTSGSTEYTSITALTGPTGTMTLKAIAIHNSLGESAVVSTTLTVEYEKAETPVFDPPGGTYTSIQSVKIFSDTVGSQIIYTIDGTDPRTSPTANHGNSLNVKESMTIKAIASKNEMLDSDVVTAEYIINNTNVPQIMINGQLFNQDSDNHYKSDIDLTVSDTTTDTRVFYTTDGTKPTEISKEYTSPITFSGLTGTVTIKVIAINSAGSSPVVSATFTVEYETVETPVFALPGDTYDGPVNLKMKSPTNGSQIIYTIDGSDPRTSPTAKNGNALRIKKSMVIRAYAIKNGMWDSEVVSAKYEINTIAIDDGIVDD